MPSVDFDRFSPDMPGFEFGRFLMARPAGGSAVCLFEQAEDLLLLVEYGDESESISSSFISDPGAQTVSGAQHWALTGLLRPGEHVRHAFLADGTQLIVSQNRPGWLTIVEPVAQSTTATVIFSTQSGSLEETFTIG